MVDPERTLGEVAAVTRVPPEFAAKIVGKKITKIEILMSMILRQYNFRWEFWRNAGNSGHFK